MTKEISNELTILQRMDAVLEEQLFLENHPATELEQQYREIVKSLISCGKTTTNVKELPVIYSLLRKIRANFEVFFGDPHLKIIFNAKNI